MRNANPFKNPELEKIRSDLVECQSIAEDIAAAKRAGIPGIEILESRYAECLKGITDLHNEYGKKK